MVKRGRESTPWTDVLPKRSIILCDFELDDNSKLPESSRKYLKRWYREERERSERNSVASGMFVYCSLLI